MGINAKNILIGAPDQSATTGAVCYGDMNSDKLPTDAVSQLDASFKSGGYVSDAGVSITPEYSTTDIKDWSRNTVRTLLQEFNGEVSFAFIQTDYDTLVAVFGEDAVELTPANGQHGAQVTVKMGAHMAKARSYVFNMKDGDARVRVVLPNAQPVFDGSLTFAADAPISWSVKLKCSADADGEAIYIYTDDGEKAA